MSSAHLVSTKSLAEFLGELRSAVESAGTEFEEMRRVVNRQITQLRATLDDREAAMAKAVENLRNVPSDESDRYEQEAVDEAQIEVLRARQRLKNIEAAGSQFLAVLNAETQSLNSAFSAGQVFLNERIETGARYWSITIPSTSKLSARAGQSATLAPQTNRTKKTISNRSFQSADELPPLPRKMQWVPIEDIDETLLPIGLEFKKAPHAEMKAMMLVFQGSVLPALANNPSLIPDDFSGGVGEESTSMSTTPRFAYECMLGSFGSSDVIVLDGKQGCEIGKMGITSGRHRILIAKELGWSHIPARVLGARHA
jgi:flagellar biosynthesis chaperone FliJ